jgi:hypothetical protein
MTEADHCGRPIVVDNSRSGRSGPERIFDVQARSWSGQLCAAFAMAAIAATVGAGPAAAQSKLDARYTVTLAGVPIGKGAWVIDVSDGQFTAAASGMTTGLLRVFASGQGTSASRGHVTNSGQPVASAYASSITSGKWTEELRIALANGAVKDVSVEPPPTPHPERVPLTEAHRKGVSDPMTAALVPLANGAGLLTQDICNRRAAIFDGRMRYDLTMSFKRLEDVKAERGYQGTAVVCAVFFTPIAGYIPDRPAIKYLIAQRDMEISFVPLSGVRLAVPFRISIPTPLGLGILQATQFLTGAQLGHATPTSFDVQ